MDPTIRLDLKILPGVSGLIPPLTATPSYACWRIPAVAAENRQQVALTQYYTLLNVHEIPNLRIFPLQRCGVFVALFALPAVSNSRWLPTRLFLATGQARRRQWETSTPTGWTWRMLSHNALTCASFCLNRMDQWVASFCMVETKLINQIGNIRSGGIVLIFLLILLWLTRVTDTDFRLHPSSSVPPVWSIAPRNYLASQQKHKIQCLSENSIFEADPTAHVGNQCFPHNFIPCRRCCHLHQSLKPIHHDVHVYEPSTSVPE